MKRVYDRSDVTAFRSVNNNTGKRVLDQAHCEPGHCLAERRTRQRSEVYDRRELLYSITLR